MTLENVVGHRHSRMKTGHVRAWVLVVGLLARGAGGQRAAHQRTGSPSRDSEEAELIRRSPGEISAFHRNHAKEFEYMTPEELKKVIQPMQDPMQPLSVILFPEVGLA